MASNTFAQLANVIHEADAELKSKAQKRVQMFESLGLLTGLGDVEKAHMSTILSNQLANVIKESTNMTNSGGASWTGGTGEQVASVVLPMVRKIFADTIQAKEFVSIQPIPQASGQIYYLDIKYANTKAGFTAGDSVYGVTDTSASPTGGLYGSGRQAYSLNSKTVTATATVSSGSASDIWYDSRLQASLDAQEIKVLSVPFSSLPDYDGLGIRAFTISGSGVDVANTLSQFTAPSADGLNLRFVVSGSTANITTGTRTIVYQFKTYENNRGDYEDRNGTLNIAEFYVEMNSKTVTARERKLKGQWTAEYAEDIKNYQGLDLESELTGMMADSIAREYDLDALEMISSAVTAGGTRKSWTAENNKVLNQAGTGFVPMTSGYYNSQGGWFETLGVKLGQVSNSIYQKTLRGSANFAVVSPDVAVILEAQAGYVSDAGIDKATSSYGSRPNGSFNGQYKVFKNPYYKENRILMGYKGASFLDTGAVLCPYVGLDVSPLILNPATGSPTKFLRTRYAKSLIRTAFFGDVTVGGLGLF